MSSRDVGEGEGVVLKRSLLVEGLVEQLVFVHEKETPAGLVDFEGKCFESFDLVLEEGKSEKIEVGIALLEKKGFLVEGLHKAVFLQSYDGNAVQVDDFGREEGKVRELVFHLVHLKLKVGQVQVIELAFALIEGKMEVHHCLLVSVRDLRISPTEDVLVSFRFQGQMYVFEDLQGRKTDLQFNLEEEVVLLEDEPQGVELLYLKYLF